MNQTAIFTLSERIAQILEGLCRAVAARSGRGYFASEVLPSALILLIWQRVKRTEVRLVALLARFQAGRLRMAQSARAVGSVLSGGWGGGSTPGRLPRSFAWLLPLVPCEAAGFGSQLQFLLADPEMVALLRASPQARRVLRPVCRMLGIAPDVLEPAPEPSAEAEAATGVGAGSDRSSETWPRLACPPRYDDAGPPRPGRQDSG